MESPIPEILRSNLTTPILHFKAMGIDDLETLDLINPLPFENVLAAVEDLMTMGFLDRCLDITADGCNATRLGMDPIWFRALREAEKLQCVEEMTTIAAILGMQRSVFLPPDATKIEYTAARKGFAHPKFDHITLVNAFNAYTIREKEPCLEELDIVCPSFAMLYDSLLTA
jgi:HrpA-like RNA helicase